MGFFDFATTDIGHDWARYGGAYSETGNYLHYWAEHAHIQLNASMGLANMTPQEILSNSKRRVENNIRAKRQILKDAGMTESLKVLDDMLSGEAWKDLDGINLQCATPKDYQSLIGELKSLECNPGALSDFAQQLQDLLLKEIGDPQLIERYQRFLYKAFGSGKESLSQASQGNNQGQIKQRIINSLLARNNEGFWKVGGTKISDGPNGEFASISTEKRKIIGAITALTDVINGNPASVGSMGGVIVRHSSGSSNKASGEEAILDELKNKIGKWLQYASACAAEAGSKIGVAKVTKELGEVVEQGTKSFDIRSGGNLMIDTITKQDPAMLKFFEEADPQALARAFQQGRVSKSDVSWVISENGVSVSLGFTVKSYNSNVDSMLQPAGHITIQSGTPLLTLLARESGLFSNDLQNLYQVAVAHSYSGGQDLDDMFNAVIRNAKMLALVDTLAGFTNEADEAIFAIINGNVMQITDIINNMLMHPNPNSIMKMTQVSDSDPGLERSSYVALNEWVGDSLMEPNTEEAEERSTALFGAVSRLMYATKIRISLNASSILRGF